MNPHGESVAGVQKVGTVKGGYLQLHNVTRRDPGCIPKTHRNYVFEWWNKLFESAISGEI